jgi:hypothetical protein
MNPQMTSAIQSIFMNYVAARMVTNTDEHGLARTGTDWHGRRLRTSGEENP